MSTHDAGTFLTLSERAARSLIQALEFEASLHERHIALVKEEREALVRFAPSEVEKLAAQRALVADQLKQAVEKRREVMATISGGDALRLSVFIERHLAPDDRRRALVPLSRLTSLASISRREGNEFAQIVDFSLNMVTGTMSILRSAGAPVNRSYGRNGVVKESAQVSGSRKQA